MNDERWQRRILRFSPKKESSLYSVGRSVRLRPGFARARLPLLTQFILCSRCLHNRASSAPVSGAKPLDGWRSLNETSDTKQLRATNQCRRFNSIWISLSLTYALSTGSRASVENYVIKLGGWFPRAAAFVRVTDQTGTLLR